MRKTRFTPSIDFLPSRIMPSDFAPPPDNGSGNNASTAPTQTSTDPTVTPAPDGSLLPTGSLLGPTSPPAPAPVPPPASPPPGPTSGPVDSASLATGDYNNTPIMIGD